MKHRQYGHQWDKFVVKQFKLILNMKVQKSKKATLPSILYQPSL